MAKKVDLPFSVTDEQRIEILRKNWMPHEARWQMAVFEVLGWEKSNNLNKAVIRDVGKVMMYRLMNALGIEAEEELGKCLKKGDNACEIVLKVNKWRKENPPIRI
jgi:hypothetical protein